MKYMEITVENGFIREMVSAYGAGSYSGIEVYWDRQDPQDHGPAYRAETKEGALESGALEFMGWAHVSGRLVREKEVLGYELIDYFLGDDFSYKGPDQGGIYPILQ